MNRHRSSAFKDARISQMATEEVDPRFADLDGWSLTSAMEAMWEGQLAAVAAIGHALAFTSWQSLAREQGLDDRQAAELMCRFVAAAAESLSLS